MAAAEADGPDYWAVHGLSHGAVLNLRKGPTTQFPVLTRIPAGYAHLENLGCSPEFTMEEWSRFIERERDLAVSLRWCRVRYEKQTGWVKGMYLQEGRPPEE
ncbi:MAG: hypothetical protein NPIRA02_04840 [Nitrospirales bacterium]|nr:MAG: hypothetical protein NPIRA02_04840 [Nitrospirales bacterium]